MAARWWDLSETELLQRDARDSFRVIHNDRVDRPVFGYEGSLEAADRDAAMRAEACDLDLYDLSDDGREPW